MSNTLVITTALEQTWNTSGPILFLGKWCDKYDSIKKLKEDNFKILDYHWDDREKFLKDYLYLNKLNTKLLKKLVVELNKYHKKNYSERYWNIIIGPWLITFIQIVFERYENLNNLFKNHKNYETIILKIDPNKMIPENYEKFQRLIMTDTWNHFIYSSILNFDSFEYKINKRYETFKNEEKFEDYLKPKVFSKRSKAYNFFLKILNKLKINEEVLISESYLGKIDEIKLCIKLKTLPRFDSMTYLSDSDISKNRNKISLKKDCENNFEEFLCNIISEQIPKSFLEDYNIVKLASEKMNWPKKPKVIFTSHFMQKTLPSRYVAENIEKFGSKLIHGQHGGVYGQYLFSSMQDFELSICDHYLSWGWTLPSNRKIIPFGILKNINNIKHCKKTASVLLMVLRSQPKYTHKLNSFSGTNQIAKYFEDNINLCKRLNKNILENKLTLRFHARKFGWNENIMFKNQFPKIKIDYGYSKITNLLKKSKLVLHTYIGTGYLETLASNIPTVVFANLNDCLINDETKEYLKILKKVNIFHDNYSSAAEFINNNWDNIDSWWNKAETQNARIIYCDKFVKSNKNKVNKLYKIINEKKNLNKFNENHRLNTH